MAVGGEPGVASICAVVACHDRRDDTLRALQAFFAQRGPSLRLRAVVVDDGSRDGTSEAVAAAFADVLIDRADGSLFWCRAMHRAMRVARSGGSDHDYLLWLNDDACLEPGAIERLVACERGLRGRLGVPPIVVGTTVDARRRPIYGGRVRASRWRPMAFALRAPGTEPCRVDTMDGNVVLVSRDAAACAGELDARFEHAMGDHDYALRAARCGVQAWLAPGVHAQGRANPLGGTFDDPALPLSRRWAHLMSPKGLPWRSWLRFTRRHAGVLWPLHFAWPYLRVLVARQASAVRQRST